MPLLEHPWVVVKQYGLLIFKTRDSGSFTYEKIGKKDNCGDAQTRAYGLYVNKIKQINLY